MRKWHKQKVNIMDISKMPKFKHFCYETDVCSSFTDDLWRYRRGDTVVAVPLQQIWLKLKDLMISYCTPLAICHICGCRHTHTIITKRITGMNYFAYNQKLVLLRRLHLFAVIKLVVYWPGFKCMY